MRFIHWLLKQFGIFSPAAKNTAKNTAPTRRDGQADIALDLNALSPEDRKALLGTHCELLKEDDVEENKS